MPRRLTDSSVSFPFFSRPCRCGSGLGARSAAGIIEPEEMVKAVSPRAGLWVAKQRGELVSALRPVDGQVT